MTLPREDAAHSSAPSRPIPHVDPKRRLAVELFELGAELGLDLAIGRLDLLSVWQLFLLVTVDSCHAPPLI